MKNIYINEYLNYINQKTKRNNIDNISRTKAYQNFYRLFPEIKWAFLASMVSRNAGWNMTDLQTSMYINLLSPRIRKQLFSTYERANWLIFSDAYPQLLLYQLSIQKNKPLFDHLSFFSVSSFMKREWFHYWHYKNKQRLMVALIINEQNVIETPVTEHPFYKTHVFQKWPYLVQNFFLMNTVILPSRNGKVIGINVHDFTDITERITLGKRLAKELFHPVRYEYYYDFALHIEPTGSRRDYERFLLPQIQPCYTPVLRGAYPVIEHQDDIRKDWYYVRGVKRNWWDLGVKDITNHWRSFYFKRELLQLFYHLKNRIM